MVEAGNHTVYVGIVEDGVDSDEARYFDMPVTLQVKEDVVAGRLEVTQVSPLTPFRVDERKSLEFRVTNGNNVPLTVLISLDEPEGWDNGAVSVNSYDWTPTTGKSGEAVHPVTYVLPAASAAIDRPNSWLPPPRKVE